MPLAFSVLLFPRPRKLGLGSKTSGLGLGDTTAWSPDLANIIIGKKMCVFVGGEQYSYYPVCIRTKS